MMTFQQLRVGDHFRFDRMDLDSGSPFDSHTVYVKVSVRCYKELGAGWHNGRYQVGTIKVPVVARP